MSRRISQLDGLRGIAIVAVFVHHSLHIPLLWMGVDLFFVLSSFLITGILLDRKANNQAYFSYFYRRRARRILPPYLLALCLLTWFKGAGWMKTWYLYAFFGMNIGAAFFGMPFTVLWSLAVEEQFYLVWPFIVKHFTARRMAAMAGSLMVVAPILRAVGTPLFASSLPVYFLTPFRMDTLASGALLAYVWRFHREYFARCGRFALSLGLMAVVLLLTIFWGDTAHSVAGNVGMYECTLAISVSALMLALRGGDTVCRVLRTPWLCYMGRISYSMYLFQPFATEIFEPVIHSKALYFAASLALTVGYASASWYLLEKPLVSASGRGGEFLDGRVVAA